MIVLKDIELSYMSPMSYGSTGMSFLDMDGKVGIQILCTIFCVSLYLLPITICHAFV